jgi:uncharacterized protein GlcG (DUF336 family)
MGALEHHCGFQRGPVEVREALLEALDGLMHLCFADLAIGRNFELKHFGIIAAVMLRLQLSHRINYFTSCKNSERLKEPSMAKALSLEDAQRMTEAALAESRRRNVLTAVSVVDARGDMILTCRLDGARSYYPDVAYGKAIGSALWGDESKNLSARSGNNSVQIRVNALNGGRIVFAPGAVPLMRDGEVIGAIGVGGSGGESDSEIAALAAKLLDA